MNGANSSRHVLIVDDLSSQRTALEVVLNQVLPGSSFTKAATYDEARKVIQQPSQIIDLAILDCKLEESDDEGIELIKLLRKTQGREGVRIIFVTAYPDEKTRVLAEKAGADACISKLDADESTTLQEVAKDFFA